MISPICSRARRRRRWGSSRSGCWPPARSPAARSVTRSAPRRSRRSLRAPITTAMSPAGGAWSSSNTPPPRSSRGRCRRPRSPGWPNCSGALSASRCEEGLAIAAPAPDLRRAKENGAMEIIPTGGTLGASVHGIDLARPLAERDFARLLRALGRYGVLCFPRQRLDAAALKAFAGRFGTLEINVANAFQEPGHPEIMILSNIVEAGRPIGLGDAGQDWHTDLSYSAEIAFANVLYALEVPRRDGRPLGGTEFADMGAAYQDLPQELKIRLDGMTVRHDFAKFWDKMRARPGSRRPPLSAEQRRRKPPVSHPIFLTHPLTGARMLYANPGYSVRINELPERDSAEILEYLFAHQLQPRYRYLHCWNEGDVLVWDDLRTIHNARADYRADERRLIKRCQVMADKIFDPAFVAAALAAA